MKRSPREPLVHVHSFLVIAAMIVWQFLLWNFTRTCGNWLLDEEENYTLDTQYAEDWTYSMASLLFKMAWCFSVNTPNRVKAKKSLWCFSLSSFNEEELSSKTPANGASRLWPPRLTILPQLLVLCWALKSSSTCWLLRLLNGAVWFKLENSFRPWLVSCLQASCWEWCAKANHTVQGGYTSKRNSLDTSLHVKNVLCTQVWH